MGGRLLIYNHYTIYYNVVQHLYNKIKRKFDIKKALHKRHLEYLQIYNCRTTDKAGLKQNDRIISFDGEQIQSTSDVKNVLKKHKIGDTVKMVVERDSKKVTVEITLQAQTQTN